MKVYFVGAGPGDPELLTCKADRLLRACRYCIYAGSLVHPKILDLLPHDAERHDSARLSLSQIVERFESARARGLDVVRLHTGDPSIYGAIREQMAELERLEIPYEVIPGVSSFQAAAAALKVELTAPELSQTVILSRAAGRTPVPPEQSLSRLAETRATLCLFLSIDKIAEIALALLPHYGPDCPVGVVWHASWPDERILTGTLSTIADQVAAHGIDRTAMVLVGQALGDPRARSRLYDEAFSHGYRCAEADAAPRTDS